MLLHSPSFDIAAHLFCISCRRLASCVALEVIAPHELVWAIYHKGEALFRSCFFGDLSMSVLLSYWEHAAQQPWFGAHPASSHVELLDDCVPLLFHYDGLGRACVCANCCSDFQLGLGICLGTLRHDWLSPIANRIQVPVYECTSPVFIHTCLIL